MPSPLVRVRGEIVTDSTAVSRGRRMREESSESDSSSSCPRTGAGVAARMGGGVDARVFAAATAAAMPAVGSLTVGGSSMGGGGCLLPFWTVVVRGLGIVSSIGTL